MRLVLKCLLLVSLAFISACTAPEAMSSHGDQPGGAKGDPPRVDSFGDPLPDGAFYRLGTVRMRHPDSRTLIFSKDGSKLMSHGGTPELRVWDIATGELVQQFAKPEGCEHLVASPDDRYLACLASPGERGSVPLAVLLEKATGKVLARWTHPSSFLALAFSKDSAELIGLTVGGKPVVRWNIAQRKEAGRVELDFTKVEIKDFYQHWSLSPDGAVVAHMPPAAAGETTKPWRFWDTASGKECRPPVQARTSPNQARWSADGRIFALVGSEHALQVWDTVANQRVVLQPAPNHDAPAKIAAFSVAVDPRGKRLAVEYDGAITLWGTEAGKPLWEKRRRADSMVFSPDGKTLAVGGRGVISLLDAATGDPVGFTQRDPGGLYLTGWWNRISFCSDGRSFPVYDQAGQSQIETATGKRLRTYYADINQRFHYGGLLDQGRWFVSVGNDSEHYAQVRLLEAATGKELWRRRGQPSQLHFSADAKTVALLSWKGDSFTLLDATTGRDIKLLPTPGYLNDSIVSKAVSDDLRLAVTTPNWRQIDLWDLDSGKKTRSLECPPDWNGGTLHFLPGSRHVVAAADRYSQDRNKKMAWTRVWDVDTGRVLRSFDEPLSRMSDDGRWLALDADSESRSEAKVEKGDPPAPRNRRLAIRHRSTGTLVATIADFLPQAFSPDGSLLAVLDETGQRLALWDTFSGQMVRRWAAPMTRFSGAAFTPDGRTLVLESDGGGSLLVVDVTGLATEPGKLPARPLSAADVDRLWLDLTSVDGPASQRARWSLVAAGEPTVKMLQRVLRRVEPPDAEKLAALIAALDSGSFKERDQATHSLARMQLARPALEDALKPDRSLEMQRRIELVLVQQDGLPLDAAARRAMRGVLLLEQIGTPLARQVMRTLASGAPGALLTQEADAALRRLAQAEKAR